MDQTQWEQFLEFRGRVTAKHESYEDQLGALRDGKHRHEGLITDMAKRQDAFEGRMDAFNKRLERLEIKILGWGSVIYFVGMIGQGIVHNMFFGGK